MMTSWEGREVYKCGGSLERKEEWFWPDKTQDESVRVESPSSNLLEWNSEVILQLHAREVNSREDYASIGGEWHAEEA